MMRIWILIAILFLNLRGIVYGQDVLDESESEEIPTRQLASIALRDEIDSIDSSLCCELDESSTSSIYGGAEYLLERPHFSEAVAFAEGSQTATTFEVHGKQIHFDYQSGIRAFIGMRLNQDSEFVQLTYSNLQGDVSIDSPAPGAGRFIVDPFGNVVGTVTVVDPTDARFGMAVVGGDLITTRTTVETLKYDFDLSKIWNLSVLSLRLDAGARIVDVDQSYSSEITLSGAPFSTGIFSSEFKGAGPRIGLNVAKYLGSSSCFSVYISSHVALLLGDHEITFSNNVGAGTFIGSQTTKQFRTLPVIETELGAKWQRSDNLSVSIGWFFHAWSDLGTSGGNFGGFFAGSDDANNMSFDGLTLKAELKY